MPAPPVRSATENAYEGNEFGNQFIFDEDNLEKFDDIMENSRLKSLIINDESDMRSPLDLIQVLPRSELEHFSDYDYDYALLEFAP